VCFFVPHSVDSFFASYAKIKNVQVHVHVIIGNGVSLAVSEKYFFLSFSLSFSVCACLSSSGIAEPRTTTVVVETVITGMSAE